MPLAAPGEVIMVAAPFAQELRRGPGAIGRVRIVEPFDPLAQAFQRRQRQAQALAFSGADEGLAGDLAAGDAHIDQPAGGGGPPPEPAMMQYGGGQGELGREAALDLLSAGRRAGLE